jgi:hypothetical protein
MAVSPPPVIDSARVLHYAIVDKSIVFRDRTKLYVNGVLLGRVPRLAIGVNLGEDIGTLLFHCNNKWQVLGTSGAASVAETKELAERNYPGIGKKWVKLGTTRKAALAYYDSIEGRNICSFCGKRPFEVEGFVEGRRATICRGCVELYHRAFGGTTAADAT